jgi:hypothetical protein
MSIADCENGARCRTCSVRSLTSQSGGARGFSETADSAAPALARGVSSVRGGADVCAVCSIRTRDPVRPLCDDAPQRVAVVLVPSAHDASCRASVTAASAFRTITRAAGVASEPPGDCPGRRSLAKDPLLSTSVFLRKLDVAKRRFRWEWRAGTRLLRDILAHRSIWGPNRFNSRILV